MPSPPLRFAYNTNGLAHHRLEDAIGFLADAGYDGVALTPDVGHLDPYRCGPADVARVAALLERRGLGVVVQTGARFVIDPRRKHFPTLLDPDPSARAVRLDFLGRCADIARDLGGEVVAFWSGAVPAGCDVDATGREDAGLHGRLVDGCRAVADVVAERGLVAAFEPEPGMFVETVAGWEVLAARVDHDAFALALDVGHVHCNDEGDPAELVRRHAPLLADVQIEDMRRGEHVHLPFGEGTLEIAPVLAALREVAWGGLVGVELSRDSHRAHELVPQALAALRAAAPR